MFPNVYKPQRNRLIWMRRRIHVFPYGKTDQSKSNEESVYYAQQTGPLTDCFKWTMIRGLPLCPNLETLTRAVVSTF